MAKIFTFDEVAKHNTPESCWVVLYGNVYDVTDFLKDHPGGSKIILQLAGQDATEEYDPIHPPGILEENLKPEAKLGTIDQSTLPAVEKSPAEESPQAEEEQGPPPLDTILNLDEIEEVATKQISRKAWAYYWSASDELFSKSFNNAEYRRILLRPRIFVDCTKCDTSATIMGGQLPVNLPIFACPAAMARLAHPDGEHGIAEACADFGALQVISQNASQTPEQIVADAKPGQVFGWQLYVQNERAKSEAMLARINKLPQIKFICLTLDAPVPGKREEDERSKNIGAKLPVKAAVQDSSVSKTGTDPKAASGPGGGIGQQLFWGTAADLNWRDTLPWLAKHTSLPVVLKGLQTHEDVYLASQYSPQVKGVILSNHGGRALDTAPPAVHTLLEVRKYCPEVLERKDFDIWVDGGIKRGTDVVKALCLGAKAVGIGRAPLFGLGAGGADGVRRVFEILKAEVETCMRLLGAAKVEDLGMHFINARAVERDIYDGPDNLQNLRPSLWAKAKAKL